ncbi:AAA family ATPase [Aeromonas veronii]|uniref:AAA family ATPase n=1 Tax=Aeromonas veronii TaxID=654 RepID=UPI0038F22256
MQPIISRIRINSLFNYKDIDWNINKRVNVLFGANGTGKSTILRLINCVINDSDCLYDKRKAKNITLHVAGEVFHHNLSGTLLDSRSSRMLIDTLKNELSSAEDDKIKKSILDTLELIGVAQNAKKDPNLSNLISKFRVEYLSTFDMTIMSKQEYDSVSDDVYTQLDFEIKKEISILTGKMLSLGHKSAEEIKDSKMFNRKVVSDVFQSNFKDVKVFTETVNSFFKDSGKELHIDPDGDFIIKQHDEVIGLNTLSSGEKQLLLILTRVINCVGKDTILLLDEPEISLHLKWQENLIDAMTKIHDRCQIIIATHSPAILMQGWMDCIVDMKNITFSKSEK